jgi:hypothetical protein
VLTALFAPGAKADLSARGTKRVKMKFHYTTQTMVTMGIFPFKEKSPW